LTGHTVKREGRGVRLAGPRELGRVVQSSDATPNVIARGFVQDRQAQDVGMQATVYRPNLVVPSNYNRMTFGILRDTLDSVVLLDNAVHTCEYLYEPANVAHCFGPQSRGSIGRDHCCLSLVHSFVALRLRDSVAFSLSTLGQNCERTTYQRT